MEGHVGFCRLYDSAFDFVVSSEDAAALKKALGDANEAGVVDLGVLAARGGGPACVVEGELRSSSA